MNNGWRQTNKKKKNEIKRTVPQSPALEPASSLSTSVPLHCVVRAVPCITAGPHATQWSAETQATSDRHTAFFWSRRSQRKTDPGSPCSSTQGAKRGSPQGSHPPPCVPVRYKYPCCGGSATKAVISPPIRSVITVGMSALNLVLQLWNVTNRPLHAKLMPHTHPPPSTHTSHTLPSPPLSLSHSRRV